MISFIQLLVTKLVEIQAFFFVGVNRKTKKSLKVQMKVKACYNTLI